MKRIFNWNNSNSLYIIPILKIIWKSSAGLTVASMLILAVLNVLPLCNLYVAKLIIDSVSAAASAATKPNFRETGILIAFLSVITLTTLLCNFLFEVVSTAQYEKLNIYMNEIINAKSVEVDLEFYENSQYQDTLQRAQEEGYGRPVDILDSLMTIFEYSISLAAMTAFLLSLHWGIPIALFIISLPGGFIKIKYAHITYKWNRKRTQMQRKSYYLSSLLNSESSAKEVRLFNLGNLLQQRFSRIRVKLYKEKLAIAFKQSIVTFANQLILSILMLAASSYIIYKSFQGAISVGDLVIYYEAFRRAKSDFGELTGNISGLYSNNLFLANLFEFLDLKPTITEPLKPRSISQPMKQGIVFNNVNFKYGTTKRKALKNINLTIPPGKIIALVGENGSGKTTLVKLICRLYDPTSGSITIDGIDIRDFSLKDLRKQFSVIFQDYVKYDFTARENIWLGDIEIPPNDYIIEKAAMSSGADEIIQSLPYKYDTVLGKRFDGGEQLSIGQWQKVALSRAFLRDSQVIILDEPSSALDPKAEYNVFQKFRQLLQNRTAIFISHRLSTVTMADWIYVLERGSIIESGTHQQLISLGGTYAHMFETQAQNYRS